MIYPARTATAGPAPFAFEQEEPILKAASSVLLGPLVLLLLTLFRMLEHKVKTSSE